MRALDLAEAGRKCGRSEKAMRMLRAKGEGPKFHKLAGRVVVFEDDLEEWMRTAEPVVAFIHHQLDTSGRK